MRHYLSVWVLFVKSCIYRVLGILFVMIAVEFVLFERMLKKAITAAENKQALHGLSVTMETVFSESRISWVCMAAFLSICIIIMTTNAEYRSKTTYTLQRLSISAKSVFLIQVIVNVGFYLFFVGIQILLTYVLAKRYTMQPELYVTDQTIVAAYYRDSFLHVLVPLSDYFYLIRNIVWLIALSVGSACYMYLQRGGKVVPEINFWFVSIVTFFCTHSAAFEVIFILVILIVAAEMLIRAWRKEAVLYEE